MFYFLPVTGANEKVLVPIKNWYQNRSVCPHLNTHRLNRALEVHIAGLAGGTARNSLHSLPKIVYLTRQSRLHGLHAGRGPLTAVVHVGQ